MGISGAGIKGVRAAMGMIFERSDALSTKECDHAIALGDAFPAEAGGVLGAGGYAPDPRMRDVTTTYLPRVESTAWLYARLDPLLAQAGSALGTSVSPIAEPVQLLRYAVGNHFDIWHSDAGTDLHDARRVSASIELSDIADHDGGVLEIAPDRMGRVRTTPRGGMIAFPSRALHHVTPVTRGLRLALVVWAG